MWFVLIITGLAIVSFTKEKFPLEVTSVAMLTALLLFGQFFPVLDANGRNLLDPASLLQGFANPSLIAVLALLVMGQAIIQTAALRSVTQMFITSNKRLALLSILSILAFVMTVSGFMNNTPLVIIAIPIVQALAWSSRIPESRLMLPLSYVAILGGMTTLVGSSTNLLVSSAMQELGYDPIGFFDFFVPGAMLAAVGFVYVIFVLPKLLPVRTSLASQLVGDKKEFIAEIDVGEGSKLIGMECVDGKFPLLANIKVRLIQRMGHLILPPFEGYKIEQGDIMIVAATRDTLADILAQYPGFLLSDEEQKVMLQSSERSNNNDVEGAEEGGDDKPAELDEKVQETRVLAEVMITPASRMIDMTLEQVGFHRQFGSIVMGIQRRARVVRRRLGRIRLEPGDVLLMAGSQASFEAMRNNQDLIVLSGSKRELTVPKKAPLAAAIMLTTIISAATGILTIPVAAITGAALMIATDCLNVRQATRAIDRKIFLLVGSMLALGTAMQVTGGADFIANLMLRVPFADNSLAMVSLLFIVVALLTNVLSNNACAILFTPIAMNLALNLGVEPVIFGYALIFAANCSFASPIGYQTNLLVMGPGHYRFRDFIKAGVPMIIVIWMAFILIAKYYFAL